MRRVRVIFEGRVQGVGYRYTMRGVARNVGAHGWVRNRADGSVEAEIEGASGQVDELLAWMAEGPPGGRVDRADVVEIPVTGHRGFEVRSDA